MLGWLSAARLFELEVPQDLSLVILWEMETGNLTPLSQQSDCASQCMLS